MADFRRDCVKLLPQKGKKTAQFRIKSVEKIPVRHIVPVMSKTNPFKPGPGLLPPYLAGREREQELFNTNLKDMAAGESVSIMVMYGPRGMGKTVLLSWLRRQCDERGIVHVAGNPADMLGSVDALGKMMLSAIRPPKGWRVERMSIGGMGIKVDLGASARGTRKEAQLPELLISHCREKPMVVLLDEAHAPSDPDTLRLFLNMAQQVAQEAPFLLILAGTPVLDEKLRDAGATFIERAKVIGLDRLDEKAAAAALSIPLKKEGVTIAENALDEVVKDSQCYPFFVQQWGQVLWGHAMKKGISELTLDDVSLVTADIQKMRTEFYDPRYRKIEKSPELLAAANALAQALLKNKQGLNRTAIAGIIKDSISGTIPDGTDIESKAQDIIDELVQHDFLWHPPASRLMMPGIPSFMAYINSHSGE